jgi:hypothetical protein
MKLNIRNVYATSHESFRKVRGEALCFMNYAVLNDHKADQKICKIRETAELQNLEFIFR